MARFGALVNFAVMTPISGGPTPIKAVSPSLNSLAMAAHISSGMV
jgi:uncharacterized membrane protein (DUF441 family)